MHTDSEGVIVAIEIATYLGNPFCILIRTNTCISRFSGSVCCVSHFDQYRSSDQRETANERLLLI